MQFYLLIPALCAVSAFAFIGGPFTPTPRREYGYNTIDYTNAVFYYKEHKLEPEFKYGDMVAFLSCNLTNKIGQLVGQADEWYKNNTLVETDDHFIVMKNNNTLKIIDPKRIHSGIYVARLKIMNNNVLITHDCSVQYFAKPLILDFPKSVYLQEGADLELKCDVKGYPPAEVTWSRGDTLIKSSVGSDGRIMFYNWNNVRHAHLAIKSIKHEEAGDYMCLAHSDYFNYSVSKHLLVRVSNRMAAMYPLLGILLCAIIMGLIIAVHEANATKRIKQEEAKLYRESFIIAEANKEAVKI